MDEINRRELLGGVTALGAIAVSGCLTRAQEALEGTPGTTGDGTDPDEETGTVPDSGRGTTRGVDQPRGTPESGGAAGRGVDDTSIETVDSSCGPDDDGDVAADFGAEATTISGTLPAPTPCHEAVIDSTAVDGGRLSIVVGVRSTREEGMGCIECVGAVTYEARIEPSDPSTVTAVTVDHATGGESTITR